MKSKKVRKSVVVDPKLFKRFKIKIVKNDTSITKVIEDFIVGYVNGK